MNAAYSQIEAAKYGHSVASSAPASSSSITELVLTKHSPDQAMVLLPMISHLTRSSDRWVTWVVDQRVSKKQLQAYGVDTRKLQMLYAPNGEDSRWVIWEALNTGTSECVIGTPGSLGEQELQYMENAAQNGKCRGLMVNYK